MTVFQPPAPLPPLTEADVRHAGEILRDRTEHMDASSRVTVSQLDQHTRRFIEGCGAEDLAKAIGLFTLLTEAVATPQIAARLPEAPYPGADSDASWHTLALELLPRAVVLAGDDAVLTALNGRCDPADLPDTSLRRLDAVSFSAVAATATWADHVIAKKQRAQTIGDILDRFSTWNHVRWPDYDENNLWRRNTGHVPFQGAHVSDRELVAFARGSGPLSYTARYPSTPQAAESTTQRSLWLGAVQRTTETLLAWLVSDLFAARTATNGEPLLFSAPTQQISASPLRFVTVLLTSGSGWRKPKSKGRTLPVPGTVYPAGSDRAEMVEVRSVRAGDDVAITIALPISELPPMDETVVAIMRIQAAELLAHVPDLTEHGRQVLTAWRDSGPEPWGPRPGDTFTEVIDEAIRTLQEMDVQWEEDPPAHVLDPAS